MAVFHSDLERSWARMLLMLGLLITLFALLKHARLPVQEVATLEPAAVTQPATAPATGLLFPLAGYEKALRDNFHEKRGGVRTHQALDIMAPRGTPVRAVDDGRIAKLYRGPMAGISIYQFDRETKRVYFYAHLDRYAGGLREGQVIRRGDVIGYVGTSGNAPESAPHLHFAMNELGEDRRWWRGRAVNPYGLLRGVED